MASMRNTSKLAKVAAVDCGGNLAVQSVDVLAWDVGQRRFGSDIGCAIRD
jgi:hypothetical protein